MEQIAVFINDAGYARRIVQPMLAGRSAARWIVVACPPALPRYIGRWLSRPARALWRERWAAELFLETRPLFRQPGVLLVAEVIAADRLSAYCGDLQQRFGTLRLLDARRQRLGQLLEPLAGVQRASSHALACRMALTTGLTAVLALAD